MRRRPQALSLARALLCCGLAACDAGLGPEPGPTFIRFVNTSPDAIGPLQFMLENGPSAQLPRGQGSAYMEAEPRVYPITISDDADSWLLSADLRVVQGFYQTLYSFGDASSEAAILLGDEPGPPRDGQSLVRVLHLAPALQGAFDVFVLLDGQPINPNTSAIAGMTYPSQQEYIRINAGTWRVIVTAAGTADVLVSTAPLAFTSRDAYTIVLLNADDGAPELIRLRDGE